VRYREGSCGARKALWSPVEISAEILKALKKIVVPETESY
jgi:hypothetical protein